MWVCNDRVLGRSGLPQGRQALRTSAPSSRAGIEDDGFRVSNPKLRLEDMDLDGVWASVIYGPIPLTLSIPEPDLQTACYAAWNDWAIEEFNASAPDRLCALAVPAQPLARGGGGRARAGRRRSATGGRSSTCSTSMPAIPAWDRLWAAAEQTGLPLSFHIKGGASPRLSYQMGKWKSAAFATLLPLQLDEALAIMVFSGALERHPGLKLVLAEAGVGWLPYFLTRMDMEWRNLRDKIDYAPSMAPSELFNGRSSPPSRRRSWPPSSSPTSGPTRACGRRTTPTPTARSPSRSGRSRRRWACSPPRTAARSRRPTAPSCTASSMSPDDRAGP